MREVFVASRARTYTQSLATRRQQWPTRPIPHPLWSQKAPGTLLFLGLPRRANPSQQRPPLGLNHHRASPSLPPSPLTSPQAVATVVGFIVLAIASFLLFLKITRALRSRREKKRRRAALRKNGGMEKRRKKGRNAFEEVEWEGVPVSEVCGGERRAS